jgi:hypothetical protein
MIQAKSHYSGSGGGGGNLKIDLEKCFIEMRREFELISLESQYHQH